MAKDTPGRYTPETPVPTLPFVGPSYEEKLERIGILTIKDLLYHFPFRYEDTRDISTVVELREKGEGTIKTFVKSIANTRTRSRKFLTKAILEDETGSISAVWFNQPYLTKTLKRDEPFMFSGKISTKWGSTSLMNPQYEKIISEGGGTTHLGKLTPIYPETYGLSSKWLRARIKPLENAIPELVDDHINEEIREKEGLLNLSVAIHKLHFPGEISDIEEGQERLGIDELIEIRKQALKTLAARKKLKSVQINDAEESEAKNVLLKSLPFTLTNAQKEALDEILDDLDEDSPMYRLLNGDVGSGKTIVALLAAVAVHDAEHSTVIMAPTTILAEQHYQTISDTLSDANIDIPVILMTSQTKDEIPQTPHIIVGTHAVIYQSTLPENIALVIIDEQHRFGVTQRKKLEKLTTGADGRSPHYLTMTATPIPRTLTMVLYGSTNVSTLDEMPPGRLPSETHVVPKKKRSEAYKWIDEHTEQGDQAFIICPLVQDSDKIQAKAATEEFKRLSKDIFKNRKLDLVHGQMKEGEKQSALTKFRNNETDILVATSVIEVGIDIPNATIMVIEDAERFGLAQLHQLRGRIGRGDKQSYCFLFTEYPSDEAQERLKYFSSHSSGFEVAEYDLKRRGPGEVYGIRQSGLLSLRFADISNPKQLKKAERIATILESSV